MPWQPLCPSHTPAPRSLAVCRSSSRRLRLPPLPPRTLAEERASRPLRTLPRPKGQERYLKKVLETPKGQKKDIGGAMPKAYSPKFVEAGWYSWWEESEFFAPAMETEKPPFVIVIPPPNVTGSLHLGHALTNAVQDAIVRWRRMSGYNALWVPGCDHAGMSVVVLHGVRAPSSPPSIFSFFFIFPSFPPFF